MALCICSCSKNEDMPRASEITYGETPLFNGVVEAEVLDVNTLTLRWNEAFDGQTPAEQLVYVAYAGEEGRAISLGKPVATSLPGATSLTFSEIPAGNYQFVVRARDEDGNEDENTAAVSVTLGDDVPPTFAGVTGAIPQSSSEILVEWKPGEDNVSATKDLRYRIYAGPSRKNLFRQEAQVSLPGATSSTIALSQEDEIVWIAVRAVDERGNEEKNERITSTMALETEPPTFAGVTAASGKGDSLELRWSPAVDNATASSQIVYKIFVSESTGDHNFLIPWEDTEPGVTRWTVSGLKPETEYFFVVQAEDLAGNQDKNSIEVSATSPAKDIDAPTFAGVAALASNTPSSITATWLDATDDRTKTESIVYEVYLSEASEGQNTLKPTGTSIRGRGSLVLRDLKPETKYFIMVRPRDEAGNIDENRVELSITTGALSGDNTPPELLGMVTSKLVPSSPERLLVSWLGASDDTEALDGIRALVCVSPLASGCEGDKFFENLNATSNFGASSVFVSGLVARTSYWASVRLEDKNGNPMTIGAGDEGTTATSFVQNVQPLLESRCNQCHAYTYGALVNVKSTYDDLFLISAVSDVNSYLLRTLRARGSKDAPFSSEAPATYEGDRMPSDGTDFLTTEQEDVFIEWTQQGAFYN